MSGDFASSKRAHGFCDRCGFRSKLNLLKSLVINESVTGFKVCRACWEPDHPQLKIRKIDPRDPQALREPRPDTSMANSRIIYVNLSGAFTTVLPGSVR
jgi:hypothetical protein